MRERNPSADSAAGMGQGAGATRSPKQSILAAKRKIPGVWGRASERT
jgi:hypothetical protein